jgi:hypothetical protein
MSLLLLGVTLGGIELFRRLTEDDDIRITEDDDIRITEEG